MRYLRKVCTLMRAGNNPSVTASRATLAEARSRRGSDSPPDCHSTPRRHSASLHYPLHKGGVSAPTMGLVGFCAFLCHFERSREISTVNKIAPISFLNRFCCFYFNRFGFFAHFLFLVRCGSDGNYSDIICNAHKNDAACDTSDRVDALRWQSYYNTVV